MKETKFCKLRFFLESGMMCGKNLKFQICFAISVTGKDKTEKYNVIKNIISNSKTTGLVYHDYDEYALVLVSDEFYNSENDEERLSHLFMNISRKLGL